MDIFRSIESDCFGFHARKAARALARAYDKRMQSVGLKATQFGVLVALASGEHSSVAEMARKLGLEPSTLQRNIDVLRRRGFAKSDGSRGRGGQRNQITLHGREALKAAIPVWESVHGEMAALLQLPPADVLGPLKNLERAALTLAEGKT